MTLILTFGDGQLEREENKEGLENSFVVPEQMGHNKWRKLIYLNIINMCKINKKLKEGKQVN